MAPLHAWQSGRISEAIMMQKNFSQAQGEGKEKRDKKRGTSSPPAALMETPNSERQLTTRVRHERV